MQLYATIVYTLAGLIALACALAPLAKEEL